MSILIKGVEMPKDCPMCPMSYWTKGNCEFSGCAIVNGKRYARNEDDKYANSYGRPSWCPLIELPPHGDLIDRDAVYKRIHEAIDDDPQLSDFYFEDAQIVTEWLRTEQTIIESEE